MEETLASIPGAATAEEARQKRLEFLGISQPLEEQTRELGQATQDQTDALTNELRKVVEAIERRGETPDLGYLGP